ncbi:NlpC/P60 family protein, partial [Acinetobacter baumannii]
CSGLVRYVFRSALGIELPRVSREMANTGTPITDRAALAAGDRYQRFKRWLNRSENAQPTSDDAEMASMLSHSSRLETVHTMRQELTALWA